MKLIIENYGRFLLEGIALVSIMGILFHGISDGKGVMQLIGENAVIHKNQYELYSDFREVYKTESEKEPPKFSCDVGNVAVGNHMLSDYIKACDCEGKSLSFQIMRIIAPDGSDVTDTYNQDTTEIWLSQFGVYHLCLTSMDEQRRTTQITLQLPVNSN